MSQLPAPEPADAPDRPGEGALERTRRLVLEAVEEVLTRQAAPFFDQARRAAVAAVDEFLSRQADPLLARVKAVALETVDEVLRRQLEPFLDRGKRVVLDGLENAAFVPKYADALKKFLAETLTELVRVHAPAAARRTGRRAVGYAVAGTLFCLATVLVFVGVVLGLEQAGLPPFAAYLVVGALAALAGALVVQERAGPDEGGEPPP